MNQPTLFPQEKQDIKVNNRQTQRDELHKTIWRIANDLRGSVTGWDFKSYVLGMLFYRFISENLNNYINKNEREGGNTGFDFSQQKDESVALMKNSIASEKGFYMPPSALFANVRKKAKDDQNLNETLSKIFKAIEGSAIGIPDAEDNFKGLFDDLDVNSNKLGSTVTQRNEKLVKLMDAVGDLPLGNFSDNAIDLFGDAYEFLLRMYASSAGKSGGEFFTPQEVSELLAHLTLVGKKEINKVYDPACGSGSLLLQFAKILGPENIISGFFGQEINLTNYNLCRINMFLHNVRFEDFHIAHGDTLIHPANKHLAKQPFEAIVSNPPYSTKWVGSDNSLLINDPRFSPAGVLAPKSKADLAFTMHILSWLAVSGTAAIVEFPGVLYRGGAEQKIRHYLLENNYIDSVIQLPSDLFFGTTIATCIIVLKKSKDNNEVLFIDASSEFVRSSNKNVLTEENRKKVLHAFEKRQIIPHFAQLIHNEKIIENNCNLAVSTWVEVEDTREKVDIFRLNKELDCIVSRQSELRSQIDQIVAELEAA